MAIYVVPHNLPSLKQVGRYSAAATGGLGYGLLKWGKSSGAFSAIGNSNSLEAGLAKERSSVFMNCFVAGTEVLTKDGYVNIEELEVGDEVWATDVDTAESGWKPITDHWSVEGTQHLPSSVLKTSKVKFRPLVQRIQPSILCKRQRLGRND